MKIAISNSSPLILLAKINALDIFLYFFDKIYIPPEVYHEVVENGLKRGEGDAVLIQNLIVNSNIEVKSPKEVELPLTFKKSLHRGELEAITLAYSFPNHPILLDDEEARIFARSLGIKVKGTLGLLVKYYQQRQISHKKAISLLDELNKLMYLSGDLYSFVLSKLK